VGGDLKREPFPDFERTIPIGEQFHTRNGGEGVLLSVDLWSDRVALHFAYEMTTPPMLGADGHPRPGPDFSMSDDQGTVYRWRAGGGGGSDGFSNGYAGFSPGVPDEADYLIITSRDLPRPIRVALTAP
jgi:hypothetical protein